MHTVIKAAELNLATLGRRVLRIKQKRVVRAFSEGLSRPTNILSSKFCANVAPRIETRLTEAKTATETEEARTFVFKSQNAATTSPKDYRAFRSCAIPVNNIRKLLICIFSTECHGLFSLIRCLADGWLTLRTTRPP